jgi:hypothetical protein
MASLSTVSSSQVEAVEVRDRSDIPLSELYLIDGMPGKGRPSDEELAAEVPGTIHEYDVSEWGIGDIGATIMNLSQVARTRDQFADCYIVMISGGNDPIHPGHMSNMLEAKIIADQMAEREGRPGGGVVIAVINGNRFLCDKKMPKEDVAFSSLRQRCEIACGVLGPGHIVVPFDISGDTTVSEALRQIKPDMYAKGGDRNPDEDPPPETPVCEELGIVVKYNVGMEKRYSSSWDQDSYLRRRLENLARLQNEIGEAASDLLSLLPPSTH